jgi:adenosylmethionine-8-amino-7-oxononanoate aminotransferase
MNWGVQPDITAVAKSITSGYAPLGAAIATKKIADSFLGGPDETFRHLITFGGHPVSAAAALANLDLFEKEDLVGNSRRMGEYLFNELQKLKEHPSVGDVRGGLGLLAAVELVADKESKKPFPADAGLAKKLPRLLYDRKIVSFRAGDVIAICPPLSITKDEIDFIINALDESISVLESELGIS